MDTMEDYLFGNGALHDRFLATTEILAKLVASAPRAVNISHLEDATGRSARELTKLCAALESAGLLRQEAKAAGTWTLTCDASMVTLEDVFRCVFAAEPERANAGARTDSHERSPNDVDLLVMQAMIAINQSVFKHLRQFSLDRLKISAAGMFPATRRPLRAASLDDAFDVAISGRKAIHVSPMQIAA